jgi:hypothetical protein
MSQLELNYLMLVAAASFMSVEIPATEKARDMFIAL